MKHLSWLFISLFLFVGIVGAEEVYGRYELDGKIHYGQVDQDKNTIQPLTAAPWSGGKAEGKPVALDKVKLLHPSEPQTILGISGSYKDAWIGKTSTKTIRWFLKPPTAAASPDEDVALPASLDTLLVETELVIVIGKHVKDAANLQEAKEAIFGYSLGNDIVGEVTSYQQVNDETVGQEEPLLSPGLKIGDGFAPFGPFIYKGVDWNNRERTLIVKNEKTGKELVYKHSTSNLLHPPEKIVMDMSRVLSLNPGDIIFSGTTKALPAQAGDVMTVSVEGLGTIVNRVVATQKK